MLNISGIHEGFVLDHIQAGMSLQIYHDLKLDKLDCTVADAGHMGAFFVDPDAYGDVVFDFFGKAGIV